jgi:ATP-dependent Clp protease ATP-binding subunit ClpA
LFSPEFRNRLDEIVRFSNLGPEVMRRVVDKFVVEMKAQLLERRIQLELTPAAVERLAEKGYDPDFGARPLARLIQREIKDPLSDEVLFGRLAKGGKVSVDVGSEGFELQFPEAVVAR